MLKPPNTAQVNTHKALVRFLREVVVNVNILGTRIEQLKQEVFAGCVKTNNLETRIERLEKDVNKQQKQLNKQQKQLEEIKKIKETKNEE